jgi:glutamyl-tRNA synthetase
MFCAMSVIVRFAPSPTGYLHVGNLRAALYNYLLAAKEGGTFILRIDDTDEERSQEKYVEGIEQDLTWLGYQWQRRFRQSERLGRYQEAMAQLVSAGRLYPCYETAEELALKRKVLLNQSKPPIYDRAALALTAAERAGLEAQGRQPHWRFKLSPEPIVWQDLLRGAVQFDPAHLSDPVLVRADGRPLFNFCSVVDDLDEQITHVFRGEDHVSNTAVQTQIFAALSDAPCPQFGHFSMIMDAGGGKLSKRLESLSLRDLRAAEVEPLAVSTYLMHLGTGIPVEPVSTLAELAAKFDTNAYSRAAPKFSEEELWELSAKTVHHLPFALVQPRLQALELGEVTADFWAAVQGNLTKLSEVGDWWRICYQPLPLFAGDDAGGGDGGLDAAAGALLQAAAATMPNQPWEPAAWQGWMQAITAATGKKGRALFMPLRIALTGQGHGPELPVLLRFIGREQALARLQAG